MYELGVGGGLFCREELPGRCALPPPRIGDLAEHCAQCARVGRGAVGQFQQLGMAMGAFQRPPGQRSRGRGGNTRCGAVHQGGQARQFAGEQQGLCQLAARPPVPCASAPARFSGRTRLVSISLLRPECPDSAATAWPKRGSRHCPASVSSDSALSMTNSTRRRWHNSREDWPESGEALLVVEEMHELEAGKSGLQDESKASDRRRDVLPLVWCPVPDEAPRTRPRECARVPARRRFSPRRAFRASSSPLAPLRGASAAFERAISATRPANLSGGAGKPRELELARRVRGRAGPRRGGQHQPRCPAAEQRRRGH